MTGSRILVVEDEALIADDIQTTLTRLGYDVVGTVASGPEAVDATARLQPALVLMDIKLQGPMDGVEAARIIRRDFDLPVLYLTSHSDDLTLARAMETAPSGYLLKPFNDRELRTATEVALHKHRLESKLAERERWFSTTLSSIGDAVIATDRAGIITFLNPVAERLTEWGDGTAIGKELGDVFRLVDGAGTPILGTVKFPIEESFAVAIPTDTTLLGRSGTQVPVDDIASPIVDKHGQVLGGVVVFRDVTQRRKLEERLALAERLASLGTMAASMGHEINNPLAAVVGNVGFAAEGIKELRAELEQLQALSTAPHTFAVAHAKLRELEEVLTDADSASSRLRHIVNDLKKFASAEGASRAILELSVVIDAAAKMTTNAIRHHARVTKRYGTTPFVEANEGQLIQVFINLLMNAAQAIGDGPAEDHEIYLTTYTDAAGRAVAEVRDNGPGIAQQLLQRIFDPFFTTKPVGVGLGLGLSISQNLVTALGGEISVESKVGQGTTFRVVLPGARLRTIRAPASPSVAPSPVRGKILVIDDDHAVSKMLARTLRNEHDVVVCNDGREALASIAAGAFYDVIFCDLMMPTLSGMDIYEGLSLANPEQAQRMVFMTGGAFTERAKEFMDATSQQHILKPFVSETPRAIARKLVAKKHAAGPSLRE